MRRSWLLWVAALMVLSSTVAAGSRLPETATVPLRIVTLDSGELKIGIEVRVGGGAPQLYTFDTGSSGFYAAYNPSWWPSFQRVECPPPAGAACPPVEQKYGSGVVFHAERVLTTVGLRSSAGEIEAEVEVAKITDSSIPNWQQDVDAGQPPLYGKFFGDFGSGLVEKNGLFAVLPQLSGNLSTGFAVQLGCWPFGSHAMIGLTRGIRSRVTSWVPMQGGGQGPPFPHSGWPTYGQKLLAGEFLLRRGTTAYAFLSDAILDTGAPTTDIKEHGALRIPDALLVSPGDAHTQVRSGGLFRVTAEGAPPDGGFDLALLTGNVAGLNRIDVSRSDGGEAFVNLGLIPFFRHDVVFDVERGLVGFAPRCSLPRSLLTRHR